MNKGFKVVLSKVMNFLSYICLVILFFIDDFLIKLIINNQLDKKNVTKQ